MLQHVSFCRQCSCYVCGMNYYFLLVWVYLILYSASCADRCHASHVLEASCFMQDKCACPAQYCCATQRLSSSSILPSMHQREVIQPWFTTKVCTAQKPLRSLSRYLVFYLVHQRIDITQPRSVHVWDIASTCGLPCIPLVGIASDVGLPAEDAVLHSGEELTGYCKGRT